MINEAHIKRINTNFYLYQGGMPPDSPFHTEKSIGDAKKRARAWRRGGKKVIAEASPLPPEAFEGTTRRDHLLIDKDGTIKDCGTINEAKRQSRALQKSGTKVRVEHVKRKAPPADYVEERPIKVVTKGGKKQTRYLRKRGSPKQHNWRMKDEGIDESV